jgi:DNA-binding XRE family transcriptional regulator
MSSLNPDEIRSFRERWMMTREDLAEKVGVSVHTVTAWEKGTVAVPQGKVGAVRKALDMGDPAQVETPSTGAPVSGFGPASRAEFGQAALLRQLGRLAKQRREEIGIGRVPLAKEAGMGSDKTIAEFEFGRRLMSGTNQRKLEKALGWRLGVIEDVMRMVNRKATSIEMEELDAEDSLFMAAQAGIKALSLVSNEDLIEELRRRLENAPAPMQQRDPQHMYGLAASTNTEHLEGEDEDED